MSRTVEQATRRRTEGCEDPAVCQWQAVLIFPDAANTDTWARIDKLPMCDFHAECRQMAKQKRKPLRPRQALALHPAAWRATR